jgi:hypothetical protein
MYTSDSAWLTKETGRCRRTACARARVSRLEVHAGPQHGAQRSTHRVHRQDLATRRGAIVVEDCDFQRDRASAQRAQQRGPQRPAARVRAARLWVRHATRRAAAGRLVAPREDAGGWRAGAEAHIEGTVQRRVLDSEYEADLHLCERDKGEPGPQRAAAPAAADLDVLGTAAVVDRHIGVDDEGVARSLVLRGAPAGCARKGARKRTRHAPGLSCPGPP